MAKLRFTNKAVEDLTRIWEYTLDTWSETQADAYYNMLVGLCRDLAESPTLGRTYEQVAEDIRGMVAGKHIIFYKEVPDDAIEIIRILHGSTDLKHRIKE